jgi:spore germination protein GerM
VTTSSVLRRLITALAAALLLAACGIPSDEGPRDIPPDAQGDLGLASEGNAGATGGAARIYLIGSSTGSKAAVLEPVARDVSVTATAVMEALFVGPNAPELSRQLRSAVPPGTALRSAVLRAGVLRVDASKELLQLSGNDLVDALAQIVFTASELDGVHAVKILVEGAEQQWPAGNGELQSEPLTTYDFPGRVASAQPAYPAIPTPTQP